MRKEAGREGRRIDKEAGKIRINEEVGMSAEERGIWRRHKRLAHVSF